MKEINIALVAHDGRKQELLEWVRYNAKTLMGCNIYATGTTGKMVKELLMSLDDPEKFVPTAFTPSKESAMRDYYDYKVTCLLSGPLGGDQQIGAMIAEGKINLLIFFCDNLIMQGHQNDVSALSRLASLYNIGFATNRTTADMLLTSTLFKDPSYEINLPECIDKYKNRKV